MIRPTERFTTRAEDYARHRPSYPPGALDLLAARCGLTAAACVADLGSGTGILTGLLLERGAEVFAVEPNDAMRTYAEAQLTGRPGFHSVPGSAEATTLPPASIDLLVAGQAFHWFNLAPARAELLRILRPGRWAALLWNERPPQPTAGETRMRTTRGWRLRDVEEDVDLLRHARRDRQRIIDGHAHH